MINFIEIHKRDVFVIIYIKEILQFLVSYLFVFKFFLYIKNHISLAIYSIIKTRKIIIEFNLMNL